jgi:hypothetical protein
MIEEKNMESDVQIDEPHYVFLTAFSTSSFKNHSKAMGVEQVYEKPLQLETLSQILK